MKRVLILMGRYLPGYKDGGPLRTVVNLTEALGDEYDFRIVSLDRDHGDEQRYPGIQTRAWNIVGKAKVWYVAPGGFSFSLLRTMARDADIVYTCGFFDDYGYKTLLLNRLGLLFGKPVAVASMGTFSPGALAQKATKKRMFIRLCKGLGLFRRITWSVTSPLEEADVRREIGDDARCIIAEDLPRSQVFGKKTQPSPAGSLSVVFLSRISPKKNLEAIPDILRQVPDNITLSIAGPLEDEAYWEMCEKKLNALPPHVSWSYFGEIPSEEVPKYFAGQDVFLFPTLGENYGHVIFEALSAGCIPVISDQTPWGDIEQRGAGFVCPLDDTAAFAQRIHQLAQKTVEEKRQMAENALSVAREKIAQSLTNTGYRDIFGR